MKCPLFKDFTRECMIEIEVYPEKITQEIMDFCLSSKHKDCPFFKMLVVKKNVCKNIKKCPAFAKFQMGGFNEFVKISNKYCTSKNHIKCKRFILKEKGEEVPPCLHPNGKCIKEWEVE